MKMTEVTLELKVSLIGSLVIDSSKYNLPIPNHMTIDVKEGTITLDQSIALLPGSELYIREGLNCALGSGKKILVYDLDQWLYNDGANGYSDTKNLPLYKLQYVPGGDGDTGRLKDALVQIDGFVDASAGAVYTTSSGANIYSTAAGVVKTKAGSETITHQVITNGTDIGSWPEIAITPAVLQNATGSDPAYLGSETGEYYYNSTHGEWILNGHTNQPAVEENRVDATCGKDGSYNEVVYCSCGYKVSTTPKTIPATGDHTEPNAEGKCGVCGTELHVCTWNEGEVTTAPGCESEGVKTYTCTGCGNTQTEAIPALGHKEQAIAGKAATCTETGLTEGKTCTTCGVTTVAQTEIPALGHKEETVTGKAATCTETGLTDGKKCTTCGVTTVAQTDIPALGHDIVIDAAKPPTCTETGLTQGQHCSRCDAETVAQTPVPAAGHRFVETEDDKYLVSVANCQQQKQYYKACETCGEKGTETWTSDKTGPHSVSDQWTTENGKHFHKCTIDGCTYVEDEATCSGGIATCMEAAECSECGVPYGEPNSTNHNYPETWTTEGEKHWKVCANGCGVKGSEGEHKPKAAVQEDYVDSTCAKEGSYNEVVYCDVCNYKISTEAKTVAKKDHTWGTTTYSWAEDHSACTAKRVCSACKAEETAKGTISSGVSIEPSCSNMGTTKYTATFDVSWAETRYDTAQDIPMIAHTWFTEYTYKWADDLTSCTATRKCSVNGCNGEEFVTTTAITSKVTNAPTCTAKGTTTYTATFTADWTETKTWTETKEVETAATGIHTGGEATCTAKAKCTVCGQAYGDVSATTHKNTVDKNETPATCTTPGTAAGTYCNDCQKYTSGGTEIPALNHAWSVEYKWSDDGKSCTATHVCGNDAAHNQTETVTASGNVTKQPTCIAAGTTTYTANFDAAWAEDGQTTTRVDVAATGNHVDGDDKNHVCDYCSSDEKLSDCTDAADDGDHKCDICDAENITVCGDEGKDHICDTDSACKVYSTGSNAHADGDDKNHICDYCSSDEKLSDCTDAADDGDHKCDICDAENITVCGDEGKDHICDTDSACKVYSTGSNAHADGDDKNHVCDYCSSDEKLSDCTDTNTNHKCDECDAEMNMDKHTDSTEDEDHVCDYGCGAVLETCSDKSGDGDHVCDICDSEEKLTECSDTDKNHKCDECQAEMNMDKHTDSAEDEDHVCDYGCGAVLEACTDMNTDSDHNCDVCGKENVTECSDSAEDEDHLCDLGCGAVLETCSDVNTDQDHNCDICDKENVTTCSDSETDKDHVCDLGCGKVWNECSDVNTDQDHNCDVCDKENVTTCSDSETDNDHVCDLGCGKVLEACSGGTATCKAKAVCKVCGQEYGELDPENHNMQVTSPKVNATCEAAGKEAVYTCANGCGKTTDGGEIGKLDHAWGEIVYTWTGFNEDGTVKEGENVTCTATRTCENFTSHVETETVDAAYTVTTEAGCNTEGAAEYTATFTKITEAANQTKPVTIPATGDHKQVEIPEEPATCVKPGKSAGIKCETCGTIITAPTETPATGKHNYVDNACTVCGEKLNVTPIFDYVQNSNIVLIEPWGLRVNLTVYHMNENGVRGAALTANQYADLDDFGVYLIRESKLGIEGATQNNITIEDIITNKNVTHRTKSSGTVSYDSAKNRLTTLYDEGLYTYEFSDSIFVLYYVVENGITYYAPIRERNLSEMVNKYKDDSKSFPSAIERDVYAKMAQLEKDILAYRATFADKTPLPIMSAPFLSENPLGAASSSSIGFLHKMNVILIEPWGLRFNCFITSDETYDDYGVVVYYDVDGKIQPGSIVKPEDLLALDDARVFTMKNSHATVTAEPDGTEKISAVYNSGIYTYQMTKTAYVMFFVQDGSNFYYGPIKERSIEKAIDSRLTVSGVPNSLEGAVYSAMKELYSSVKTYRAQFGVYD